MKRMLKGKKKKKRKHCVQDTVTSRLEDWHNNKRSQCLSRRFEEFAKKKWKNYEAFLGKHGWILLSMIDQKE